MSKIDRILLIVLTLLISFLVFFSQSLFTIYCGIEIQTYLQIGVKKVFMKYRMKRFCTNLTNSL